MKNAITKKEKLSVPGLDKLKEPILKYKKDDAAELVANIMNMMLD
jgi:hypothetical protein